MKQCARGISPGIAGVVGFALASLTPLSARYPGVGRLFERYGRRIVVADMELTMVSLSFLWLSVVGAI